MGLPYGLRDIKIGSYTVATGVVSALVDLPNAQTLSFSEKEDFQTLRGDDKDVAKRGAGPSVEWSLEAGGITFAALVILNGGTVTTSGTGLTKKDVYAKLATDSRPDFYCEGQAISESGGDFHTVLRRCKADGGFEGELKDGEFWVSKASGTAFADLTNRLYEFVENATTAPTPLTAPV